MPPSKNAHPIGFKRLLQGGLDNFIEAIAKRERISCTYDNRRSMAALSTTRYLVVLG